MALTERRAEFVYDGARLAAIAAKAPIIPVPWAEREDAFKAQFLDVIERQCGPQRSSSPDRDTAGARGWDVSFPFQVRSRVSLVGYVHEWFGARRPGRRR